MGMGLGGGLGCGGGTRLGVVDAEDVGWTRDVREVRDAPVEAGPSPAQPLAFTMRTLFDHAGAWPQCLEDGSIWYPYGNQFVHSASRNPSIISELSVPLGRYDPDSGETMVTQWKGCTHKGTDFPGTVLFQAMAWRPTVVARWSCLDPDYGDYPLGWLDPVARTVRGPLVEDAMHSWPSGPTAWAWGNYICGQAAYGLVCTNRKAPQDSLFYEFPVSPYWDVAGERLVSFLEGDLYLLADPDTGIQWLSGLDTKHFDYAAEQDAFYAWRDESMWIFRPPNDWTALPPASVSGPGTYQGFFATPDGRFLVEKFRPDAPVGTDSAEAVAVRETATGARRVLADRVAYVWPTWPRYTHAVPPRPAWAPWLLVTGVSNDGSCTAPVSLHNLDTGAVFPVGRTGAGVRRFHVLSPGLGVGNYFAKGVYWYLYPPAIDDDGGCQPQDEKYDLVRVDLETGDVNTILRHSDGGSWMQPQVLAFAPDGRFVLTYEAEYTDPTTPNSIVPYGGTVVAWDITDPSSPRRIVLAHNAYSHIEPCGSCYLISTLPGRELDTSLTVVQVCPIGGPAP